MFGWLSLSGNWIWSLALCRFDFSVFTKLWLGSSSECRGISSILLFFSRKSNNHEKKEKYFLSISHLELFPSQRRDQSWDWKEGIPVPGTPSLVSAPASVCRSELFCQILHPEDALSVPAAPWSSTIPRPELARQQEEKEWVWPESCWLLRDNWWIFVRRNLHGNDWCLTETPVQSWNYSNYNHNPIVFLPEQFNVSHGCSALSSPISPQTKEAAELELHDINVAF